MAKLPKDHPIIIKLTKKIECAKKHAKGEYGEMKKNMGIQLRKIFNKQLTKHRGKSERIIKELEIITSQKTKSW